MSVWLGSARGALIWFAPAWFAGELGIGIGDDVLAVRREPFGVVAPDPLGVRANDAKSGSSNDFFFCLRDRCGFGGARVDEPAGDRDREGDPPWRGAPGDCTRLAADCWDCWFEDALPMVHDR